MEQLGEGGKSVHELDKARKRAEMEKEELQAALEEAESALEQEEAKVLRAQMELSTVRQEIDRRIHEKEEEFENTRRNHARSIESMQASLEAESRAKQEALKQVRKTFHLIFIFISCYFFRKRNLNRISMNLKLLLIMPIVVIQIYKKY
jgi:myosin heavy chain 6/7